MPLLETRKLSKRFGGLVALSEVSLQVNQGEILGIIGPNGAGKTTLFNVLTGFLRPTSGEIVFKGEPIAGKRADSLAKKGLVRTFQLTTILKTQTVLENMIVAHHLQATAGFWAGLCNLPSYRKQETGIEERAMQVLERVGLTSVKDSLAGSLPYGYQRLLEIGMALAAKPGLLLLDEPVCGMNPTETLDTMRLIQQIREGGITVMVIEHQMQAIMGLSDRIVVLNFGHKITEGIPKEIRENKEVIEAYLGAEEGE